MGPTKLSISFDETHSTDDVEELLDAFSEVSILMFINRFEIESWLGVVVLLSVGGGLFIDVWYLFRAVG